MSDAAREPDVDLLIGADPRRLHLLHATVRDRLPVVVGPDRLLDLFGLEPAPGRIRRVVADVGGLAAAGGDPLTALAHALTDLAVRYSLPAQAIECVVDPPADLPVPFSGWTQVRLSPSAAGRPAPGSDDLTLAAVRTLDLYKQGDGETQIRDSQNLFLQVVKAELLASSLAPAGADPRYACLRAYSAMLAARLIGLTRPENEATPDQRAACLPDATSLSRPVRVAVNPGHLLGLFVLLFDRFATLVLHPPRPVAVLGPVASGRLPVTFQLPRERLAGGGGTGDPLDLTAALKPYRVDAGPSPISKSRAKSGQQPAGLDSLTYVRFHLPVIA